MELYSDKKLAEKLQLLLWDSTLKGEELVPLLKGEVDRVKGFTRFNLYNKILNGFNWHEIRHIIPEEKLKEALADDVLNSLFPRSLKETYTYVRSLL